MLFLLIRSQQRLVQDRIRNYLQKYLPMAAGGHRPARCAAKGVEPGTPKWDKAKEEVIAAKLNARPKKPAPEEVPPPGPQPPVRFRAGVCGELHQAA